MRYIIILYMLGGFGAITTGPLPSFPDEATCRRFGENWAAVQAGEGARFGYTCLPTGGAQAAPAVAAKPSPLPPKRRVVENAKPRPAVRRRDENGHWFWDRGR